MFIKYLSATGTYIKYNEFLLPHKRSMSFSTIFVISSLSLTPIKNNLSHQGKVI